MAGKQAKLSFFLKIFLKSHYYKLSFGLMVWFIGFKKQKIGLLRKLVYFFKSPESFLLVSLFP